MSLTFLSPFSSYGLTTGHLGQQVLDCVDRISQEMEDDKSLDPDAQGWSRKRGN